MMLTRLSTFCAVGLTCLLATSAWAVSEVIPYNGILDLDGSGFSGDLDMTFTLHRASSGGEPLWEEVWDANLDGGASVTVTGGRFSVSLGTHTSVQPIMAVGSDVYLSISLRLADSVADYRALTGRQRLSPVPLALSSANATDLNASGLVSFLGGVLGWLSDDFVTVSGSFVTTSGNLDGGTGNINAAAGDITTQTGTVSAEIGEFDSLQVDGALNLSRCRLCINHRIDGADAGTICVRLQDGSSSGFGPSAAELDDAGDDRFGNGTDMESRIVFVCDRGASGWHADRVIP